MIGSRIGRLICDIQQLWFLFNFGHLEFPIALDTGTLRLACQAESVGVPTSFGKRGVSDGRLRLLRTQVTSVQPSALQVRRCTSASALVTVTRI